VFEILGRLNITDRSFQALVNVLEHAAQLLSQGE